jgi:hypothetical protein
MPLHIFKALDAILVPDQLHPDTEGYCGMTVHFVAGESGKLGGAPLIGEYCAPQLDKEAGARQICD